MKINVKKIAILANVPIKPAEEKILENQLEETLNYVQNLSEINTDKAVPTSSVTGLENVTRDDIVKPSLSQEEALSNSNSTENGLFKVKGVFGDE